MGDPGNDFESFRAFEFILPRMQPPRLIRRVPWAILLCLSATVLHAASHRTKEELREALHDTGAVALVLDLNTGHLIAAERPEEAARMASGPGSTLKPFFLAEALNEHLIEAKTRVFCDRKLRIANRELDCMHPAGDGIFDAEHALAYSCNTYFAALATRFAPRQAVSVLRAYGFAEQPHLFAAESSGSIRQPESQDQLQLLVLGLEGVMVTPAQLAAAYRRLARERDASPVTMRGLEGSVNYGMAHNAATSGIDLAGKTGTASDPGERWTHGWFVGIARRRAEQIVVVLYLPHGSGGDAAMLARRFLVLWSDGSGS